MVDRTIEHLLTVREVVTQLGGIDAVVELCGLRRVTPVYNWTAVGFFPAKFYKVMIDALAVRNCSAPHELWQQIGNHDHVRKLARAA